MGYPPQQQGHGYPPQQQQYGGAPPPGQYGAPQAAPSGPLQYARPGMAAEVAGEGRSKAQLIVGIDFVSTPSRKRVWCSC